MLPYNDFREFVFNNATTSIKLVDDCGNVWNCNLIFVTFPCKHFKLGGEWSGLVPARRISIGDSILLGAQSSGPNESIYLMLYS
ncbi:hypothetical protein TSUD_89940 [Trifolium subterraneum]|uniref:TF-B3 domain-containing protein n=1 Tax=Trifolium subterraneum TaxID=3900 RepID=A0A2Z6NLU4_TRISU|nr:hypothetical protein TSUD_89940 [Trifolium subterraneum]